MFPRSFQGFRWCHSDAKDWGLTSGGIFCRNTCFRKSAVISERFTVIPSDAEFNPERNDVILN